MRVRTSPDFFFKKYTSSQYDLIINKMTEVSNKRRSPADKESFKRLRTDINQAKDTFESISKQLLQVVEYLTLTEIRLQQLENMLDKQGEKIKNIEKNTSPEFPYIEWSNSELRSSAGFTSPPITYSPPPLHSSDSELDFDLLELGDHAFPPYEDHQLLHISPLSLEEHPGTILNLLCDEVMD
jgi:hypothetical protein